MTRSYFINDCPMDNNFASLSKDNIDVRLILNKRNNNNKKKKEGLSPDKMIITHF